ncbi:MAG: hypothetical protein Q4B54_13545 [Coriobacteriales bacterium]|nr:hypothetical protein [Coriobacteriales bacterium]
MDLRAIRDAYIDGGLDFQNATARTCRDVILTLVSESRMADHVSVKGGVVMQQISGDRRRATRDLDLDFVRHHMTDEGIALMANSKEQVCAEKLRSLMRIGVA